MRLVNINISRLERKTKRSLTVSDYARALFSATVRNLCDFVRKRGMVDPYFGRNVRGLVEQLGFVDVIQEGWTLMCRGGEPLARFDQATLQMASKPMIAAGLLEQEQVEDALRLLQDPAFIYPAPVMYSAWGKKPL